MLARLIILCAVAVCVQAADTNQIAVPNNQQKLGPGDKVSYRVIEDQDDPKPLTVTDSGHLDVPYLGLVHVAGKSTQQVAKEVKGLLEKDLYYQATVVIALELVNRTRSTGKVYVTGQVRNKGGFDISGPDAMTVSKAILAAGGFSDFSDKKNVRLIRKGADGTTQTFVVNVVEIWEKGKLEKDLVVQPDDMVVVPARLVNY
jgi:polysaccharide biosynthesis/export protein